MSDQQQREDITDFEDEKTERFSMLMDSMVSRCPNCYYRYAYWWHGIRRIVERDVLYSWNSCDNCGYTDRKSNP